MFLYLAGGTSTPSEPPLTGTSGFFHHQCYFCVIHGRYESAQGRNLNCIALNSCESFSPGMTTLQLQPLTTFQPQSWSDPSSSSPRDALGELSALLPKEGHAWCPNLIVLCAENLDQQRLIRPSALHGLPKLSGLVLAGQVQQSQHSLFEIPAQVSLQHLFQILQGQSDGLVQKLRWDKRVS